jgi:PAS domain S-box-containing protein
VREKADIEFDDKGNAIKAIGFTQDITERKKSEIELLKAKEKVEEGEKEFRLLAEAMPQIVWVTRVDGWNTYFNQQWVDYTGQTLEESSGHGWAKPFHPDDQQRAWLAWQNAITNNETYSLECQIRKFDGSYRWWLVRGVPIFNQDGKISKWFGTCTDIHEIKHKEIELLNAKEKAEESDRLKSAFLANMSHEIRTPMNGILGFSRLLKEPKLTGKEQQKYIGIIEKSGARMLNIINDIIDISKIEAGLMTVDITESDINEQIEYIYTFFMPEVEAKGMKLSYKNTLPAKEAIIKTDREKIFAILTNLVKNAIKYSNKGSIEFGYNKKGDFIEFFVKDNGIGIPKERQAAIFKRFIQSDIEDKMARQGAGLGLAITKAYIEMLGGSIWVESQEGKGSIFYFTIPYNAAFKKEINIDPIVMNEDVPRLGLKILIVEDDEISGELLSIIVEKYEKETISVTNGNDAVEACRKNPDIDLILMDIRLPGMDGYEVTQRIREFNEKVIIIAQTAYGLTGDREKALNAGCNDYISKPIKKEVFDVLIQTYFKK